MLVAGCGRIGFGAASGPTDADSTDDAAADVAIDGTAVDAAADAAGDAPVDAVLVCPPTYTRVQGSCYRLESDVEAEWAAAAQGCEADGPGAHLVVVDDAAELLRIMAVTDLGTTYDVWIGTTDRITDGTYLNVHGAPAFVMLAPDQMDPGHHCLELRDNDPTVMFDTDCTGPDDYLCEYDGIPAQPGSF